MVSLRCGGTLSHGVFPVGKRLLRVTPPWHQLKVCLFYRWHWRVAFAPLQIHREKSSCVSFRGLLIWRHFLSLYQCFLFCSFLGKSIFVRAVLFHSTPWMYVVCHTCKHALREKLLNLPADGILNNPSGFEKFASKQLKSRLLVLSCLVCQFCCNFPQKRNSLF